MKRLLAIPFLIFLFALGSCSSVTYSYDVDKTVDFTKFKTYAFTPETYKIPIQELNRARLITAVEKELNARGLTKSESPDILVDLIVKASIKQEAVTTSTGGAYGYRYGWAGGGTTRTDINEYVQGTLFVNVISKESLVWQGRAVKTIDETASPEKREASMNSAMTELFKKYPVQPAKK